MSRRPVTRDDAAQRELAAFAKDKDAFVAKAAAEKLANPQKK